MQNLFHIHCTYLVVYLFKGILLYSLSCLSTGQGSWSYLGTDATRVPKESFTMNLGFVDRSTVLHEFGHSLGLIHEHQSPFPGGFEWDRENVS